MSVLPFTLAGRREKSTSHHYEIDNVEERMFVPSEYYIRQGILQSDILGYLARRHYRKAVYMIVGIKVALGGKVVHSIKRGSGGDIGGTVPGSSVGIPIDIGGKVSTERDSRRFEQKQIPRSFVFAYRLREIRYSKKSSHIEHREYTKHADLHDLHNRSTSLLHSKPVPKEFLGHEDEIDIDGISAEDYVEDEDESDGYFRSKGEVRNKSQHTLSYPRAPALNSLPTIALFYKIRHIRTSHPSHKCRGQFRPFVLILRDHRSHPR
jgi:hypothetical protein